MRWRGPSGDGLRRILLGWALVLLGLLLMIGPSACGRFSSRLRLDQHPMGTTLESPSPLQTPPQ